MVDGGQRRCFGDVCPQSAPAEVVEDQMIGEQIALDGVDVLECDLG
ncbi:hypothetical protein [Mycobacteroides franklinii]|nr:hypothetical protein [Mycobacteroides franklinii]